MAEEKEKSLDLRITFRIPPKTPAVIATEMIVQPNPDGVLLSFFDVIPPIISSGITPEELDSIRQAGVIAECVSKVFIPKSRYKGFVNTMASILNVPEEETKKPKRK